MLCQELKSRMTEQSTKSNDIAHLTSPSAQAQLTRISLSLSCYSFLLAMASV